MGECGFCHQEAGFLKKEHEKCRRIYDEVCGIVRRIVEDCFASKTDFYIRFNEISAKGYVSECWVWQPRIFTFFVRKVSEDSV